MHTGGWVDAREALRGVDVSTVARGKDGAIERCVRALLVKLVREATSPPLNTKGYSSTDLAMGFANVRAGTRVPARTLANPIAR